MPTSQVDISTPKRSPWRRALSKLTLTPSRRNISPDGNTKKSRRVFSSPTKKMKKRSKKKAARKSDSSQESDQVVMVQILPKSPMRYGDSGVASRFVPESPPRILKPSKVSFETEIIFNEMLKAYIRKFHNHGGSFEDTEGCSLCSKGKEVMTPMVINVEKEHFTSATITVADSNDDSMSVISSAMSELTIPLSIRLRRPLWTGEFFDKLTTSVSISVSNAAYVFICPCAKMPPPREQEEDYSYSDNTDYDDVEHDDDDKSSGDE